MTQVATASVAGRSRSCRWQSSHGGRRHRKFHCPSLTIPLLTSKGRHCVLEQRAHWTLQLADESFERLRIGVQVRVVFKMIDVNDRTFLIWLRHAQSTNGRVHQIGRHACSMVCAGATKKNIALGRFSGHYLLINLWLES